MENLSFKYDPYRFLNEKSCFPRFKIPKCIGYYSLSGDDDRSTNFSQLKYLSLPETLTNLHMDLKESHRKVTRKSDDFKGLQDLLLWIREKKGKIDRSVADTVCSRGLLQLIMTTLYQNEGWEIMACCVNDVIYLCARETEEQKLKKLITTKQQKKLESWRSKFKQCVLTDKPGAVPDTSQPVDEREEFNCVFVSSLGGIRLIYGAEMDGIDSNTLLDESDLSGLRKAKFIEVKTNRIIENQGQRHNFERHKLLQWWCQSYLVGVQKIICGFLGNKGEVREIRVMEAQNLWRLAKGWRSKVCVSFCVGFLQFVRSVVKKEKKKNANIVWRFIWNPQQPVRVVIEKGNKEFAFLPDWYLQSQQI